jgi:DNA-directed RNA polymerase subunit M/transcription elongation factor TFIIS
MDKNEIYNTSICPKCGGLLTHGFRINSIECRRCKYEEDVKNDYFYKFLRLGVKS